MHMSEPIYPDIPTATLPLQSRSDPDFVPTPYADRISRASSYPPLQTEQRSPPHDTTSTRYQPDYNNANDFRTHTRSLSRHVPPTQVGQQESTPQRTLPGPYHYPTPSVSGVNAIPMSPEEFAPFSEHYRQYVIDPGLPPFINISGDIYEAVYSTSDTPIHGLHTLDSPSSPSSASSSSRRGRWRLIDEKRRRQNRDASARHRKKVEEKMKELTTMIQEYRLLSERLRQKGALLKFLRDDPTLPPNTRIPRWKDHDTISTPRA